MALHISMNRDRNKMLLSLFISNQLFVFYLEYSMEHEYFVSIYTNIILLLKKIIPIKWSQYPFAFVFFSLLNAVYNVVWNGQDSFSLVIVLLLWRHTKAKATFIKEST